MKKMKENLREKLVAFALFSATVFYLELSLHLISYASIDITVIYLLIFSVIFGGIMYIISSLFPRKWGKAVGILLVTVTVLYFETQLVYSCIFGGFMPLKQLSMGAGAVGGFFSQTVHAIGQNMIKVLVLLLPLPVVIILFVKKKVRLLRLNVVQLAAAIICVAFIWGLSVVGLHIGGRYEALTNPNSSTDNTVKEFGVSATLFQEAKSLLLPQKEEGFKVLGSATGEMGSVGEGRIDFAALAEKTDDPELKRIDEYLASISPLPENEYTGIAEGYNLITICAEAFSPYLISEELTPTLYYLSNNGLIFKNFYNSFPNTTTNGEYTMNMGLMPDMSRNKIENSFNGSADNYLPLCLGNIYSGMGYKALAYHNYYATFYDRHITHINMGYDFKAILSGLEMELGNPSSDLEMIKASMPDYINSTDPFHVYYMTYSGHYQYNWENDMSKKNRDKVSHLPYSDEVKAYIACNLELEYALCELMNGLKEAGKDENTVIVLSADHYPYGLNGDRYDELAGKPIDRDFEKFRSSFICYIPGMERVEIESYCSTPDILPTVLNIMGVDYDSRLLAGSDVMADIPHFAVLSDRSFIAEEMRYNAATDEVVYTDEKDEELLAFYRGRVDNIFTLSSSILETDYYSHALGYESIGEKPSVINFEDITNEEVFIESTITFMVDKGFMEPESEKIFGKNSPGTVREFIEVLYKMTEPEGDFNNAYQWAIVEGLSVQKELASKEASTYGDLAEVIYRYSSAQYSSSDLNELQQNYPLIETQKLIALSYCQQEQIIMGDKENSPYDLCDMPVTRYHIAAFLQRMYMRDMIV